MRKKAKTKTARMGIRLSPKSLATIDKKAKIAKLSRSEYMVKSALEKSITVVNFPEKKEITRRLTEISSAINKTNILAYDGKIKIVYMDKTAKEVSEVWQLLNSLISQTEVIKE